MIKRYLFVILGLSLFLISCAVGPDDMLNQFNDNLLENVGDGIYISPTGVSVNTKLIPFDVYSVYEHDNKQIVTSDAYKDHEWTIKDNKTGIVYNMEGAFYIAYIGSPYVDLLSDRTYTLTVYAKNRNGKLFTDSATVKVVKK